MEDALLFECARSTELPGPPAGLLGVDLICEQGGEQAPLLMGAAQFQFWPGNLPKKQ